MPSNNRSASIYQDAIRNCKISTDIETFRDRYIETDSSLGLSVTLPGFDIRTFDRNLFLLLSQCELVTFKSKWEMRPDYVSFEYYGIEIYWPLIMYVNNCFLIEEFADFESILIPQREAINELSRHRDVDKKLLPLLEPKKENVKAIQFFKNYPYSDKLKNKKMAQAALSLSTSSETIITEPVSTIHQVEFTMDVDILSNQYIDLPHIPDSLSNLSIFYNNFRIALKYNFDYTLIATDDNELSRISWNPNHILLSRNDNDSSINSNTGIRRLLKLNDTLTIKYSVTTYSIVS
jgi:hypothetical protein